MGIKKENDVWLHEKLQNLTQQSERLIDGDITTNYSYHTALKLIALQHYAEVFSRIVTSSKQREHYDAAVYVDLFAGSGLVKIKDSNNNFLPGSPLCVGLLENNFDHIVCVESDQKRCKALNKRLSKALPRTKFDVIHGNCNISITKVVDTIHKRYEKPILLTFVDPEGLEIKFRTLKTLSDNFKKCDYIINVNSRGVKRAVGKHRTGIDNIGSSIEDYYEKDMSDTIREMREGNTPQDQYASLLGSLGKRCGDIIDIKETKNKIAYHLLGFTRQTKNDSPYAKVFGELKSRLAWADANKVRHQMEVINNKQSTLSDFSL